MMITFVSQCQKNALKKTRRVLDAFADRIGDNVWQTVITEDGLAVVKKMLRQTASKNTAVACHWIRSRSRSELTWIVGNRRKFSAQGIVPVNSTQKDHQHKGWESGWQYLPLVKALTAVAALLHDWGKATILFQNKLEKNTEKGDPLRHEWVSCLLLHALIKHSGNSEHDAPWLNLLTLGQFDERALMTSLAQDTDATKPLENLPPMAQLVAWLIVTHHRLPSAPNNEMYKGVERKEIGALLKSISAQWGYQNKFDEADYKKRLKDCFVFTEDVLSQSDAWLAKIKKWSARLLQEEQTASLLLKNGAWRVALHHARLSLMLGDHYYSSCDADKSWKSSINLYANTDNERQLKQRLDEHLVNVSQQALSVAQSLARFGSDMLPAYDIKSLKQKSSLGFEWQDQATEKIKVFRKKNAASDNKCGWFIVNMASTGCGKTMANAKIMRALSEDGESLRFILALGLRTLTLQTGDEYRERIGLNADELAVLIGSSAVKELHEKSKNKNATDATQGEIGSESMESLLDEDIDYQESPTAEFLDALFPKSKAKVSEKNKAFLYKPVLACTIDHIIAATETTRGGKYILPCLRLLSSDLVIDEVDDFDGNDLIAIGRLIHLAGMLGRKVMISSATIPPALAEGFFNAYQEGWRLHHHFIGAHADVACAWVDEFKTQVQFIDKSDAKERCQQYATLHRQFIQSRVLQLQQTIVKRQAYIVRCDDLYQRKSKNDQEVRSTEQAYFEKMKSTATELHKFHHSVDPATGKKVSFGVIRVANIPPCIALAKYLVSSEWEEDFTPKVMAYHSRQVLLLRHEQERHLDQVLKRKEALGTMPAALNNPLIREHLNQTSAENVLFILVATPVEEVGRDHDFDWAVVEPSSYRSIIQLAGRVRRHRHTGIDHPNIAVMQYNLKALRRNDSPAYCRPGYENSKSLRLKSHDLYVLLDEENLNKRVDATPRISPAEPLRGNERLADLEHKAMGDALTNYTAKGPERLQAWLTEYWWLTALPQQLCRFRASSPELQLYLVWINGSPTFCEKDEKGKPVPREDAKGIHQRNFDAVGYSEGFWLLRKYEHSLRDECGLDQDANLTEQDEQMMYAKSLRYGEISIPIDPKDKKYDGKEFEYSDQFGLCPKTN